ncbi:PREDICTED: uncharacterized protein LOC102861640 [Elephantulus edwardii]|uniref:uncharacterized protein LOC102861640 n=1 Tax=Elephantulus edwardii TaxID=28737 RepID=UPI0003F0F156|nr:PREDICTED: uncharacterized protein LOC102861640 [Elephantulus edwardii]
MSPARHSTTQLNTTQLNTTQHNSTQHNSTQHSTTQHNSTQHSTTQHNSTQHSTTRHTPGSLAEQSTEGLWCFRGDGPSPGPAHMPGEDRTSTEDSGPQAPSPHSRVHSGLSTSARAGRVCPVIHSGDTVLSLRVPSPRSLLFVAAFDPGNTRCSEVSSEDKEVATAALRGAEPSFLGVLAPGPGEFLEEAALGLPPAPPGQL